MARENESLLNLLILVPWWVSVVVSGTVYLILKYIIPGIEFQDPWSMAFLKGVSDAAPLIALVLLIPAPVSAFNSWLKRKRLDKKQ